MQGEPPHHALTPAEGAGPSADHKNQLAEGHVESTWYNRVGSGSQAFDTPLGRVGFLICNGATPLPLPRSG